MISHDEIFEKNRSWAKTKLREDPEYFSKLASEIMGVEAGHVFVHSNLGNVVANTDRNAAAVVDYAVVHLQVKHIIVCGHYDCGGVNAAMQSQDLGTLNPWLRNIRDVYRLHKDELDTIPNERGRCERLVELNVVEQCINVDLRTGLIKDLPANFEDRLTAIQEIYNLTDLPWFRKSSGFLAQCGFAQSGADGVGQLAV